MNFYFQDCLRRFICTPFEQLNIFFIGPYNEPEKVNIYSVLTCGGISS
jgi:hypothetical protein